MFDKDYKEALENMKLTDDFKAALVSRMKSVQAVPRARLVLISVAAVLVLATSAGLAANVATNGRLFQTLFGGQAPLTTEATTLVTEETTDATTTVTDETTLETTVVETTVVETTVLETTVLETTATPTPTVTPKPTETTKATTVATTAATTTTAPSGRVAPVVRVTASTTNITVSWDKIASADLVGYKVVASINDSTPQYSENGYFTWITNRNTTSCTIKSGDCYNNGDFSKFSGGTKYYFTVTAVYGSEWQKITGNVIQATMPGTPAPTTAPASYVTPVVSAVAQADGVLVTWNKIDTSNFDGYKVVYSSTNPNPAYPGDGYYSWITDRNTTSCLVSYCDVPAGDYWFSVTALYDGHNVMKAGNAVKVTMPGKPADPEGTYPAVSLNTPSAAGGTISLSWSKTADTTGFCYYKVVASETNSSPSYPADGYVTYITNADECSYSYGYDQAAYANKTVYFAITAVYSVNGVEHYSTSNVQTVVFPAV